jgi:hypothetical protein
MSHFMEDGLKESDIGFIYRVSGPLVIAEGMSGAAMFELVSVAIMYIILAFSFILTRLFLFLFIPYNR